MMNTVAARHIAAKIAELIELASIFQARYGKNYRMKPGSPDSAWDLHQTIFNQQTEVARLLDYEALADPLKRMPTWWKWQETIDSGAAAQIAQEVSHLIACCASFEANPLHETSPVILCSQRVIAGVLHPSCVLIALEEMSQAQKSA
ncbi:MAG: hypothetical protein JNJ61_03090 [Anaerolineae bacterium]|nr:hypothetical protein [Anaerolineae bacterium]